ncbi:hypothetical protein D1841_03375 [Neglecta sp. X4]|uniref:FtsX-like permease family protein n=1 Tax=unclassified Neglectibacter TaxID=2632164 RepID=UPI00136E89ED|nr:MULTISPECIES: FtsX-like permease family protein [unclassified Neglectibacter]NBI16967.1 hypothetical protein [Neglectibacter sp. 59]NBJ72379.1 hypothetical protein [Neglectibacter sp. X4]NCE80154.1 hypothetical protein [Neglectibacter sp. X58]
MKKTYCKSILRTVRSSLSRFLAIFAIVALGVGFLAGLLSSPGDMRASAEQYYDDTDFYDLRAVSTLGMTEEDIRLLEEMDGIEGVMPVRDMDFVVESQEGDALTLRMHTLPEEGAPSINTPVLMSGRLPEQAGECAVILTKTLIEKRDWIGETLALQDGQDLEDTVPAFFTVVGTVQSSTYLSMEQEHTSAGSGTIDMFALTVPESFHTDYYTGAYLTAEGVKNWNSFGGAYEKTVDGLQERLEALGEDRAKARYEEIKGEAEAELADAKEEYEKGKADAEQGLAEALDKLTDGQKEIEENQQKLLDAKQEIEDGKTALSDNRAALQSQTASAQQQIDSGYAQINQYQQQIDSGRRQLDAAQKKLDEGKAQVEAAESQLLKAKEQLDQQEANLASLENSKALLWEAAKGLGLEVNDTSDAAALALIAQLSAVSPEAAEQFAPLQGSLLALQAQGTDTAGSRQALEAGKAAYAQNAQQVQASRAEVDKGQKELSAQRANLQTQQAALSGQKAQLDQNAALLRQSKQEGENQLAEAEAQLADAQAQYDDGIQQLEDAKKELAEGQKEYDEGKAKADKELADAWEQILDGEAQIRDIEEGQWYVFDRMDNTSYASYAGNADKIAAIAAVFPLFFFLVAALVALTTMTRMVEEDRQQIGTLKALGYSSGQIAAKYLLYAAAASLAGCAIGLAVGSWLFPSIIITAYNIMYDIPYVLTPFNWLYAAIASIAAVVCTMGATLNACWHELREVPARLMLPKAPKAGKRILLEYITPLWSRLKFTQKVTARNLIRYKKRFFMTITGIAGCTALLLTGFGVKDSISDITAKQFTELNHYQLTIGLSEESALEGRDLQAILEDESRVAGFLPAMQEAGTVVPAGDYPADSVTIFAPSDVSLLPEYYTFRHRTDGGEVIFDENAVIITEKLAERQRLRIGDTIILQNHNEQEASLTITDICENYVHHTLYLSPAAYEEAFGEAAEMNSILCRLPEGESPQSETALTTALLQCRDVAMTTFNTEISRSFDNTIQSLNLIVVVLIISAGALAFVVLYNLTNINITEREKELATIKVLGFFDREVAAYVYRETAILTVIGCLAGLGLGVALHQFVIRTAEVDIVMFGRSVYPLSYLWSALLTLLFSVLVNLVMGRKLKNISMVESMKAPE